MKRQNLLLATSLVAFIAVAPSCTSAGQAASSDSGPLGIEADIETQPLHAALERIPFATPTFPDVSDFPEEVLLAHLECVVEVSDGEAPSLAELATVVEEGRDNGALSLAYSDCAVSSGVGDFVEVYFPPDPEEVAQMQTAWTNELLTCLEAAGYEDPPTSFGPDGALFVDYETLLVQDPNAQGALDSCEGDEEA